MRRIDGRPWAEAALRFGDEPVPGATSYRLHRSESGPQGPFVVAADGLTATSHRLTSLPHGRTQHVAVEPLDGCLPGRWSDAVPVTPCDPGQAPGALVPQALGPYHVVVAVDVHGNRSAW